MQVVGAIIKNHQDEYLLQLRDDNAPTFKNKWTLFGGRVEDGELPEDALLRELVEELSIPSTAIESLKQVQLNEQENGVRQHIFEVMTSIALNQLVLGEGAEMRYVSRTLLFDREFAFNIKDVLRAYTATM
jgi:8-oxo-dGTP diphosphatase